MTTLKTYTPLTNRLSDYGQLKRPILQTILNTVNKFEDTRSVQVRHADHRNIRAFKISTLEEDPNMSTFGIALEHFAF